MRTGLLPAQQEEEVLQTALEFKVFQHDELKNKLDTMEQQLSGTDII
jgi:hypothetical protein